MTINNVYQISLGFPTGSNSSISGATNKRNFIRDKLANVNKVMHIAVQISNEEALPLEDKFEKGKESN